MVSPPWLSALVAISITHPAEEPRTDETGATREAAPLVPPEGNDAELPVDGARDSAQAQIKIERERRVVQSCETALGSGECLIGRDTDGSEWVAHVVFSEVAVDVALKKDELLMERRLQFSTADSAEQRHVAAGLLIAAMTAAARLAEAPKPEPPKAEPSPPEAQPAPEETDSTPKRRDVSLDLGIATGPILGNDRWGVGGLFRTTLWTRGALGTVGVTASLEAMHSTVPDLKTGYIDGGLGPEFPVLPLSYRTDARISLEGVVSGTHVYAVPETVGAKTALRGGARIRFTLSSKSAHIAPFVGASATALAPQLEIRRDGEELIVVPLFRFGLAFGLRWQR